MSRIFIIDGNSLLFRAFYALYRPGMDIMRAHDGTPTNAIFAFRNMITRIKDELTKDDRIVVCFDTGKPTFRSAELDSYKMNRKPCEPELKAQFPLSREFLDCLNVAHCEVEGYEADDLAGSLTYYALNKGDKVTLFTSDKDYLQLLKDNVEVHFLRRGLSDIEVFTKDNIKEKLGYEANQVTDYKGLVGDPSDNIKGVKGIGNKTALKLLDQFGHIEDILVGIKDDKAKSSKNIIENQDVALFCKRIATIKTDLDVKEYYDASENKTPNYDCLLKFYKKLDFNKFAKEVEEKIRLQDSLFGTLFEEVKESPIYKGVIETTELDFEPEVILAKTSETNYHKGEVLGFYLANKDKCVFLNSENAVKSDKFKEYLVSDNTKMTYDLKCLTVALYRLGLPRVKNVTFDLLLATYLLNADVKETKEACLEFYDLYVKPEDDLDAFLCYAVTNLKDKVIASLKENEEFDLYKNVELPLATVLAKMEIEGFPLNKEALEEINIEYKAKLESLEKEIYSLVGHELNLKSPKQVAALIYDELKLKKRGRNASTDIDVLKSIEDRHPVIPLIIEHRKYSKLVSSYTDSLKNDVFKDGKLHALFNQALTTTGRLSMKEPNLQNISIRDEEGKEIRKAFFYEGKKYKFLSFDYSQIELRVLASIAYIEPLMEVFNENIDIHSATASKVFNVPMDQVTPLLRRQAKAVNFGIVYGISEWGLAQQIGCSPMEAKMIIESFYNVYDGLKEYEDNTIKFARDNGYVQTMFKRRRYLKDINSSNYNMRQFS